MVEVKGKEGNTDVAYKLSTMASHEGCYRTLHENGTSFLTGVVPAVFVRMLAEGKIKQKGVLPPECLDALPILRELSLNGVDTHAFRTETTKIQNSE